MNVAPVMSVDLTAYAANTPGVGKTPGPTTAFDIANFQSAYAKAGAAVANVAPAAVNPSVTIPEISPTFKAMLSPLMSLDGRVDSLGKEADRLGSTHHDMKPGEMVKLTVHCYQFMFQSEVTSNVANRTSDGVQQLFREQA